MEQDFLAQYPAQTRNTYGQVLDEFRSFMHMDAQGAGQDEMNDYYQAIQHQSSATVHKKLSALRSYMTYLNKRGIRSDNPLVAIRMPKIDRLRSVKVVPQEKVRKLMDSFDITLKDRRDSAMIAIFLHGLRLSELVGLNVEDYQEGNLWVTGKGNKTRIVPLTPRAQEILENYLGRRRTGPMFVATWSRERIGKRAVQYAIKERAGVHPHALRHTTGTLVMRATGNLALVQDLLGHANPSTTRIYARLDTSDLREGVEQSNILGEAE